MRDIIDVFYERISKAPYSPIYNHYKMLDVWTERLLIAGNVDDVSLRGRCVGSGSTAMASSKSSSSRSLSSMLVASGTGDDGTRNVPRSSRL